MTTATLEINDRIYFLGCEDEACIAEFGSGHHHGDQFKQWEGATFTGATCKLRRAGQCV